MYLTHLALLLGVCCNKTVGFTFKANVKISNNIVTASKNLFEDGKELKEPVNPFIEVAKKMYSAFYFYGLESKPDIQLNRRDLKNKKNQFLSVKPKLSPFFTESELFAQYVIESKNNDYEFQKPHTQEERYFLDDSLLKNVDVNEQNLQCAIFACERNIEFLLNEVKVLKVTSEVMNNENKNGEYDSLQEKIDQMMMEINEEKVRLVTMKASLSTND